MEIIGIKKTLDMLEHHVNENFKKLVGTKILVFLKFHSIIKLNPIKIKRKSSPEIIEMWSSNTISEIRLF